MSEISDYGITFRYHSTTEYNDFLECPDPYHLGGIDGKTDFGAGLYLSNDEEGALAWGARQSPPSEGTLNVYDINPRLFDLNGIFLSDETEDIMRWACTTAANLELNLDGIENYYFGILAERYLIETKKNKYHWILSRRTDDSMYSYLKYFFAMGMTFEGLIDAYYNLSFGDELVIKTPQGIQCISLNEEESRHFVKSSYLNWYDSFKNEKMNLFSQVKAMHSINSGGLTIEDICSMIMAEDEAKRNGTPEYAENWVDYVQR